MRLSDITLEGFRGALAPLSVELGRKSLCLFAENGYGKSTIADGLEFWSHADLQGFHKDGCRLDAAVHVYADKASVSVQPEGSGPLRRELQGANASPLAVVGQVADPAKAAGLPILRHETVRDFMLKSAGDKKKELLNLVGLEPLNGFREALRSAKTEAKRGRDTAAKALADEERVLGEKSEDEDPIARAEELRKKAKLPLAIESPADILGLKLDSSAKVAGPDLFDVLEGLEHALALLAADEHKEWDSFVVEEDDVQRQAVANLLREGRRVLPRWGEESCPLCLTEYSTAELTTELEGRIAELADVENRYRTAKSSLEASGRLWRGLATSLEAAQRRSPEQGWPNQAALETGAEAAKAHAEKIDTAIAELGSAPPAPELPDAAELEEMRKAAAGAERPEQRAGLDLALLRAQFGRVEAARGAQAEAETDLAAVVVLLGIADEQIEAAINAAIAELGEL
ncbi:MAG TPA: hypothetical protein VG518_05355, partial [Solirubrobacterales bacterium]|nr:hypothetical protein [Solirubrobacterales bacterium]